MPYAQRLILMGIGFVIAFTVVKTFSFFQRVRQRKIRLQDPALTDENTVLISKTVIDWADEGFYSFQESIWKRAEELAKTRPKSMYIETQDILQALKEISPNESFN